MSTEAKNPNGPTPLRPVPLCHRLLAAPASVDRSCVGSACSMWRERRPGVGHCREVFATIRQAPLWLDPAQDAPEPAEPVGPKRERLEWAKAKTADAWGLGPKGCSFSSAPYDVTPSNSARSLTDCGAPHDRHSSCSTRAAAISQIIAWAREDGNDVAPWPGGTLDPVEPEPVGLVRALGDSEERLAKVLQELETTRVALAEAEAELERLGSTRAVSYEYQIKWES